MGKHAAYRKQAWQQDGQGGWWDASWHSEWEQDGNNYNLNTLRYDQMKTTSNAAGQKSGDGTAGSNGQTIVQTMQKAVNASRKANARVTRL